MSEHALGPTCHAVISTDRLEAAVSAWCVHLRQRECARGWLGARQARQWRAPGLAGARVIWLANDLGEPWLCFVEDDSARPLNAFEHCGWLSLEVGVSRVDDLLGPLRESPFEILGEPADLDVSPNVRAMQVRGLAGEVVYLTEVRAEVPGFELAQARCPVDRLFIPVLLAADRDQAVSAWEALAKIGALRLDTRITVINRARRLSLETKHPIAALQLGGGNLLEIDELHDLRERPRVAGRLPAGVSMIGVEVQDLSAVPLPGQTYEVSEGPFTGRRAALVSGHAGELVELIERSSVPMQE